MVLKKSERGENGADTDVDPRRRRTLLRKLFSRKTSRPLPEVTKGNSLSAKLSYQDLPVGPAIKTDTHGPSCLQ